MSGATQPAADSASWAPVTSCVHLVHPAVSQGSECSHWAPGTGVWRGCGRAGARWDGVARRGGRPRATAPRRGGLRPTRCAAGAVGAVTEGLRLRGGAAELGRGVLTDAHRRLAGPPVVLQADADGGADEPEAGLALVHHGVPVAEAVTADVAVHRGVRGAAVAGWGQRRDR